MSLHRADLFQKLLLGNGLRMAFQAIVDLSDGSVFGYEALARGQEELEMPGALFPCARELGQTWELEKACREKALESAGASPTPGHPFLLFINASPGIFADPRFSAALSDEIEQLGCFCSARIVIELTEQECLENRGLLKEQVKILSDRGFFLALDDFGAGNSGLKTLIECRPAFIKLDRDFIRNIDKAPFRRELVRSFFQFARSVGTTLIAEGVETWEELEVLARIGIRYIQGFLLQRPSFALQEIQNGVKAQIQSLVNRGNREDLLDLADSLRGLYEPCLTLPAERHTCEALDQHFRKNTSVDHLILSEEGRPSALVTRQHFYSFTGGPLGYSLFQKRPAKLAAKANPLKVLEETAVTTLADLAMERKPEDIYDPVIVTDNKDRILGTVTMKKLITRSKQLETENALGCNPLTGLPGNRAIERWVASALPLPQFSVIYADLDHFKEYNDRYGFLRGDDLIRFTASLLGRFLLEMGEKARLGHVGGDDFVVISPQEVPEGTLRRFCEAFDLEKSPFFDTHDLKEGAFPAVSRAGEEKVFPLVTVSLAVIRKENLPEDPHPGVLSRESAALKKLAKQNNAKTRRSGFLVDRRKYSLGQVIFQTAVGLLAVR